jgi:rhomboid protease GluP
MAVGLVPHYAVEFPIEGLTNAEFLVIIREVARTLDWNVPHSELDGLVAYTKIKRRSTNEKILLTVYEGIVTLKSETLGGQFFDQGKNKKNIDDFITCYDGLRSSIAPEELKTKADEITENQIEGEGVGMGEHASSILANEKTGGIWSIFIPVRGYFITPILIDLNILVFLLMIISGVNIMMPDNESLLKWGANFRPSTLEGQPWRLLTCCFLHIGILHLMFNMYALLYIGILLEPRLGSWRFGIAYLITGILSSMASLYMHEMTLSAGASGAIFGMYGVFLAMLTTNLIEKSTRKPLLTSIAIFVGYNLMYGMKGGIDNAAHIGGLVSGIIIGYSFYPGLTKSENRKLEFALPAILIIALLVFSSWEYRRIPNDMIEYQRGMKKFARMERKALRFYDKQGSAAFPVPAGELLTEIKDTSLVNWRAGRNLIQHLDSLHLPDQLHKRDEKLIAYCDLRINCFQLMYLTIKDTTQEYYNQIRDYNVSIDSLVKTIK